MTTKIPTYEETKQKHLNLGRTIGLKNQEVNALTTILQHKQQTLGSMVAKHRELGMLLFEQEGKIKVLKPKKTRRTEPKQNDPQKMTVAELSIHIKGMPEKERVRFVSDFLLRK